MNRRHLPSTLLAAAFAALALLASHSAYAANTQENVNTGATNLMSSASYTPSATPGATSDVTFINSTYGGLTFTATNLGVDSVNDLDTTQSLIITNSSTTANYVLTLTSAGGGNVVGLVRTDLIYVAAGGNLAVQNGPTKNLGVALGSDGNFDVNGSLAISGVLSGLFNLNKTGTGALTLSGVNTFGNTGKTFTLSAGTLNINNNGALGNSGNDTFQINAGTTIDNTSSASVAPAGGPAITLAGSFTALSGVTTNDLSLGNGVATMLGDTTITVNGNGSHVFSPAAQAALWREISTSPRLAPAP